MKAANESLFAALLDRAGTGTQPLEEVDKHRWVRTTREEKQWLTTLSVKEMCRLTPRLTTARFEFEARHFFAIVGANRPIQFGAVFQDIELNAGIFTALVNELRIPVRDSITPLEIIEHVLPLHHQALRYAGHELTEIVGFFEPVCVYEIPPVSSIAFDQLTRLSLYWAVTSKERIIVPFSADTLRVVEDLCTSGPPSLPSENLLNSLHSAHWPHAFLEVYRCIERIFSCHLLQPFYGQLGISVPLLDFVAELENVTGWRPREEDAINKVFALVPHTAELLFESVKGAVTGSTAEKTGGWVYDLRNSIVHFRPATKRFDLSDEQWDKVVRATLLLIGSLYATYDVHLVAA